MFEFMLSTNYLDQCVILRYLIPLQLWQLKALFGDGPLNFNKLLLKILRLAAIRRLGSSLLHSIIMNGIEEFFEKKLFSMK